MTDPERVREALTEVVDPCSAATGSALDIVAMGLVKAVDVDDGHVAVDLRLTTPACHMVPYFDREVRRRVGSLSGVDSVAVETDAGVEWTAEMLSPSAVRRREAVLAGYEARYGDGRRRE